MKKKGKLAKRRPKSFAGLKFGQDQSEKESRLGVWGGIDKITEISGGEAEKIAISFPSAFSEVQSMHLAF